MYTQIAAAARAATTAALVGALSAACAPAADIADMWLNPTPKQPRIEASEQAFHNRFMVADLHADTLMWHRGLREYSSWGQVDLNRLKTGNVGLQVFTMVTRAPVPSSGEPCTSDRNFDPTPLLAFASAWPAAAWRSPYQRALVQAQAFRDAVAVKRRSGIELVQIRSLSHLEILACPAVSSPRRAEHEHHCRHPWRRRRTCLRPRPRQRVRHAAARVWSAPGRPDPPFQQRLWRVRARLARAMHRA